jgi:hypothetical protein
LLEERPQALEERLPPERARRRDGLAHGLHDLAAVVSYAQDGLDLVTRLGLQPEPAVLVHDALGGDPEQEPLRPFVCREADPGE